MNYLLLYKMERVDAVFAPECSRYLLKLCLLFKGKVISFSAKMEWLGLSLTLQIKDGRPYLFHSFRNKYFNKISLGNMLYFQNKL